MSVVPVVLLVARLLDDGSGWHLPATIQALQEVEVRESGEYRRGTLIQIGGGDRSSFMIKKGERFQMLAVWGEGRCLIRYMDKQRDIGLCPWLEGFSDHESDVFKVISGYQNRAK